MLKSDELAAEIPIQHVELLEGDCYSVHGDIFKNKENKNSRYEEYIEIIMFFKVVYETFF